MALPGSQEIEALIRGRPGVVGLERTPERLRGGHIVEYLDPRDPAHARPIGRRDILLTGAIVDGDAHANLRGPIEPRRPCFRPEPCSSRRPWQRIINKELG